MTDTPVPTMQSIQTVMWMQTLVSDRTHTLAMVYVPENEQSLERWIMARQDCNPETFEPTANPVPLCAWTEWHDAADAWAFLMKGGTAAELLKRANANKGKVH